MRLPALGFHPYELKNKLKFRLYKRGAKGYYVENNETGQQESLHTKDKTEAIRLWNAKNETNFLAGTNLQVARAYMVASDPHMPERDWQEVVDFIIDQKTGANQHRWKSFSKDRALRRLWKLPVQNLAKENAFGATSLLDFVKKLSKSRAVWLMVPAAQRQGAHRHGFLADMQVEKPTHLPGLVVLQRRLFKPPDPEHIPEKADFVLRRRLTVDLVIGKVARFSERGFHRNRSRVRTW